jgi:hypothetical protein
LTLDKKVTVLIREPIPKDYYWFATLENDFPDLRPVVGNLLTLAVLLDGRVEDLDQIPKNSVSVLIWWMSKNLLQEKIMKLDQWYETAFHLCKQRFDITMDWLEQQPVPKILLMTRVLTKFATEQQREMRKASRKK